MEATDKLNGKNKPSGSVILKKTSKKVSSTHSTQVTFPIGVKLAIIIGFIVLVSLGLVTILNSHFIGQDVQITAENSNLSINTRASSTVEDKLNTVRSNVFQLLDLLSVVGSGRNAAISRQAEAFFFERNQDIASIFILSADSISQRNSTDVRIVNNRFFLSNEIDTGAMLSFLQAAEDAVRRSVNGETIALNASPYFEMPVRASNENVERINRYKATLVVRKKMTGLFLYDVIDIKKEASTPHESKETVR